MVIAILQVELSIAWAASLKDKRRVVRSLKDRLHHDHQVSVAETATLEDPRVATLGVVLAASDVAYAQRVIDLVLNKVRDARDCVLADHAVEILTGR